MPILRRAGNQKFRCMSWRGVWALKPLLYYDDSDILDLCNGLVLQQSYGLRTFWDLQQNQEIQKDEEWQKKIIDIEMRVSQNPDFQRIAFFHHLIFEKRG